jgi:3-hydroxyacyl-CoA dehydrogenase
MSVGPCECGDLVGIDLMDEKGEAFAHGHLDPDTAELFVAEMVRAIAEARKYRRGKGH